MIPKRRRPGSGPGRRRSSSPANNLSIVGTPQPVVWTEIVGATAAGNVLTKTAADGTGNAGAISTQTLDSGDGYVEWVASGASDGHFIGLSNNNTDADYPDVDFAFREALGIFAGKLQVEESGVLTGGNFVSDVVAGDVLRITVNGGVVRYMRNGVVVYTSLVAPTYPLLVDTALYTQGAPIAVNVSPSWVAHSMHEIEADLGNLGVWVNLTPDLTTTPHLALDYGQAGTGPLDLCASTGRNTFALDNSTHNSAGLLGYYSPQNANCRAGFQLGISVRYSFRARVGATPIVKFVGRLKSIAPEAGRYLSRKTVCGAVDWMDEAAQTKVNIPTQVGQRSDQVLSTIVAAIRRQPLGTDFDIGDSTFPYVVGDADSSALTLIQRVCQSEYGHVELRRGVLTFEKRTARLAPLPAVVFDGTMRGLAIMSDTSKVKNIAKVTVHPKRVDVTDTVVLFSKPDESNPAINPGETITITGRYNDPANRASKVGGMDMQAPAATTDYFMNAQEDGLGADLTADCVVLVVYGANQAEYRIQNKGAAVGYLVKLQARGRGLYDYDPIDAVSSDATSIEALGESQVALDMPYQSDLGIAGPIADFLVSTWVVEGANEATLEFLPRDIDELEVAMGIEPGDALSVVEAVTGVQATFFVQHVSIASSGQGPGLTSFQWSLQRALVGDYWHLGVAGLSELGVTTVLGPF